jgi:DNA adenine methylase
MNGYPAHEGCGGLMMLPAAVGLSLPHGASGVVFCTTCFPKIGLIAPGASAFVKAREASREAGVVDVSGELGAGHIGPAGRLALHHAVCGDSAAARRKRTAFSLLKALLLVDAQGCPTEDGRALAARIGLTADVPPVERGPEQYLLPVDLSLRKATAPASIILANPSPARPTIEGTGETWRQIPGHEGRYDVSDMGRVRTWIKSGKAQTVRDTPRLMTPVLNEKRGGYFYVGLRTGGVTLTRLVHRLVLEAFVGPRPDDQECRHLNGNSKDNRLENLAWGTHVENIADAYAHGNGTSGEDNGGAKLTQAQANEIRRRLDAGETGTALASEFGVSMATVSRVKHGLRYAPAKPFVRYVGGKGKLLPDILAAMPETFGRLLVPFVGGGALVFALPGRVAYISDANTHLVNAYVAIRDSVEDVIVALADHKNDRDYYDGVVEAFNDGYGDPIWRAAAFLYMNRVGFNGVCRYSLKGKYNVPFGDNPNATICDADNLRACSVALRGVEILAEDFRAVEERAQPGDVVYLDPPYVPESKTASFTGYWGRWGNEEHEYVAALFSRLTAKRVHVLASNSDTPMVRRLYAGFEIRTLSRSNSVNSKASARGGKAEILVLGGTWTPRGGT